MKKIPMRMCVVTRERLPKNELIRIVKSETGVIVDESGRVNGHGVYLKLDESVINEAKKNGALKRALECDIPDSIYEELLNKVNNK